MALVVIISNIRKQKLHGSSSHLNTYQDAWRWRREEG